LDGLYSYCKQCATAINTVARQRRRQERREQAKRQVTDGAAAPSDADQEAAGVLMEGHRADDAGAANANGEHMAGADLAQQGAGSEPAGEGQGAERTYAEPGQCDGTAAGQAAADGAAQYAAYDSAAAQQYDHQYSQAYMQHYHAADAQQHYAGYAHASAAEYEAAGMQQYRAPAGVGSEYQYGMAQVAATLQDYHHHRAGAAELEEQVHLPHSQHSAPAAAGGEHYCPEAHHGEVGMQLHAAGDAEAVQSAAVIHDFMASDRPESQQRKRGAPNHVEDAESLQATTSKRAAIARKTSAAPVPPQRPRRK